VNVDGDERWQDFGHLGAKSEVEGVAEYCNSCAARWTDRTVSNTQARPLRICDSDGTERAGTKCGINCIIASPRLV
jgi:hypothetical protein